MQPHLTLPGWWPWLPTLPPTPTPSCLASLRSLLILGGKHFIYWKLAEAVNRGYLDCMALALYLEADTSCVSYPSCVLGSSGLGRYLGEGVLSAPRWLPTDPADLKGRRQSPFKLGFTSQEMLQSRLLLELGGQPTARGRPSGRSLKGTRCSVMGQGLGGGRHQHPGEGGIPARKSDLPRRWHTPLLIFTKCTSPYFPERQMSRMYPQEWSSIKYDLLTYNSQSSQMQGKWLRA